MVTGAAGMLGHAVVPLLRARGHETLALDLAEADVTDFAALQRRADTFRPDWVAHLAALTNVDGCESETGKALRVNGEGAGNAARAAAGVGASVMLVSTDYVFDGSGSMPWRETDAASPLSAYGRSKLAGEVAVREADEKHLIVRTAWLFGAGGRNFVDTILAKARQSGPLKVVDDQRGTPTWTGHFAAAITRLMESGAGGTWHVTNSGEATWHDLAVAACEDAGVKAEIGRQSSAELGRPAGRPAFSVLDNGKFVAFAGSPLPHWRDGLRRHLAGQTASEQGGVG